MAYPDFLFQPGIREIMPHEIIEGLTPLANHPELEVLNYWGANDEKLTVTLGFRKGDLRREIPQPQVRRGRRRVFDDAHITFKLNLLPDCTAITGTDSFQISNHTRIHPLIHRPEVEGRAVEYHRDELVKLSIQIASVRYCLKRIDAQDEFQWYALTRQAPDTTPEAHLLFTFKEQDMDANRLLPYQWDVCGQNLATYVTS
jgi:hypothetical protein